MTRFIKIQIFVFLCLLTGCEGENVNIHMQNDDFTNRDALGIQTTPDSQIKAASKNLISSTLGQIFGKGSAHPLQQAVITALIDTQFMGIGGGPCDPYKTGDCSGSVAATPGNAQLGDSQLTFLPPSGSIRAALVTRACNRLVAIDDAMNVAASQVMAVTSVTQFPYPDDTHILGSYDLFYTGQETAPEVLNSLRAVIDGAKTKGYTATEAWRFLLLTLCLSPGWML